MGAFSKTPRHGGECPRADREHEHDRAVLGAVWVVSRLLGFLVLGGEDLKTGWQDFRTVSRAPQPTCSLSM